MDEGLTKWLSPAANVLLNFLVTTGEEVNLVKVYKMNLKSYSHQVAKSPWDSCKVG